MRKWNTMLASSPLLPTVEPRLTVSHTHYSPAHCSDLYCCCVVDTDGFVKVLSDKKTDRMLGAHIIGSVSAVCLSPASNDPLLYPSIV